MSVLRLRAPVPSEFAEQMAVIDWWALWAPTKGLDARLLLSVPNGAYLAGDAPARARQAAKLKASGMRVGVPDLLLALPTMTHPGLFLEMKSLTGRLSDEQRGMMDLLAGVGYVVVVAKGADEAIRAIKEYVRK